MASALQASLPFVLRWEGGFVNHPADPGGATNKGVTQRVYDGWRTRHGLPKRGVREIEHAEVQAIYEADYWFAARCDALARKLDLVQFDTAVNMGVQRAIRFLQAALECGVDGQFGPTTLTAASECDAGDVMALYCATRERFYRTLAETRPSMQVFLKGWLNRLNALRLEVGLPAPEGRDEIDFGDMEYIARIPDIDEDPSYDIEPR
jgi:lysozyme family protein